MMDSDVGYPDRSGAHQCEAKHSVLSVEVPQAADDQTAPEVQIGRVELWLWLPGGALPGNLTISGPSLQVLRLTKGSVIRQEMRTPQGILETM